MGEFHLLLFTWRASWTITTFNLLGGDVLLVTARPDGVCGIYTMFSVPYSQGCDLKERIAEVRITLSRLESIQKQIEAQNA